MIDSKDIPPRGRQMRIQYAYIIGIDFLHTKETFMLRRGIKLAAFYLSLLLS